MVINLESPRIDSFIAGTFPLVEEGLGLAPTINTGAPWGPAQATVAMDGPAVTQIVLYGMRWEDQLVADIEMHFFCYPNRVVARMDIIPHAAPPTLLLGWVGTVAQVAPFPVGSDSPDWDAAFGAKGPLAPAAVLLPPLLKGDDNRRGAHVRIERGGLVNAHYQFYTHEIGIRTIACTLLAANDESSLRNRLRHEIALRQTRFKVANGRFIGYDDTSGLLRFIMKPGVSAMRFTTVGVVEPDGTAFVAAVLDRPRRPFVFDALPPANVQWLPKTFSPSPGTNAATPGTYVFAFQPIADDQTLQLQASGLTDAPLPETAP